MDEKTPQPQETKPANKGSVASKGPPPSRRNWALILCALVAGGWFFWPRGHHARVLGIEERVQNILTHTPLIGQYPVNPGEGIHRY